MWFIDVLSFFDMLSVDVCITRHWQKLGQPGAREIHNLDPQPHRHCMLASRASALRVTRCSLGKYWSHDFFQKEAGRMLPGIQAGWWMSSYLGQIGCQGDGVSRQPGWGTQVIYDS